MQGNYMIELKINGEIEQTRSGGIGGNMGIPLKFIVNKDQPGTYKVDINGQKSYFTIVDNGENSRTDSSNTVPLIGFIVCAISVIIISILLIYRLRANYRAIPKT